LKLKIINQVPKRGKFKIYIVVVQLHCYIFITSSQ